MLTNSSQIEINELADTPVLDDLLGATAAKESYKKYKELIPED